jgi:glucuronokinase
MVIRKRAYPRGALVGNPSDAYFGKTITITFSNFFTETILYETPEIEIRPGEHETTRFGSMEELVKNVERFGYDGGIKLIKATIKVFYDYCKKADIQLDDKKFTIFFESTIPFQVGLGGSSAVITSCICALMSLFKVDIPKPVLANLILSVERDELGIPAGLQDRVAQVYEGLVFMDFNKSILETKKYGVYEHLDPALLPPLYIAYRRDYSENSKLLHYDLRKKYMDKDPDVLKAIGQWAELTDQFKDALLNKDFIRIERLTNKNFDLRKSICVVDRENIRMIEMARSIGASAKFTGSGGAIIGTYKDEAMYEKLSYELNLRNISVIKPVIANASDEMEDIG